MNRDTLKAEGLKEKITTNFSSLLLALMIVFFSISLYKNYSNVKRVENEIKDKEADVEKAKKEQEELTKKLEYTKSEEFIEKQLRDKLGLAKQGEIVVILPPADIVRKFAPKYEEEKEVLPDPNWKRWLKLFI